MAPTREKKNLAVLQQDWTWYGSLHLISKASLGQVYCTHGLMSSINLKFKISSCDLPFSSANLAPAVRRPERLLRYLTMEGTLCLYREAILMYC